MYRVTKHGAVAFSETLAIELSAIQSKVKVSVLCPAGSKGQTEKQTENSAVLQTEAMVEQLVDDSTIAGSRRRG